MNPEDNIKKFFKKRLQDSSPAEDLWNVPSDDIWNAAKVHFPRKKKRKRPFIFWMFGLGLPFLAFVGFTVWNSVSGDHLVGIKESNLIEKENIETSVKTDLIAPKRADLSNTLQAEKQQTTVVEKIEEGSVKGEKKELNKNIVKNKAGSIFTKKDFKTVKKGESTATDLSGNLPLENESKNKEKASPSEIDVLKERSNSSVENLPKVALTAEPKEIAEEWKNKMVLLKTKKKMRRWEIGLSYSPFIISPRKALSSDLEVEDNETLDFTTKYRNINIPISRKFNNKWSLTSGLSYAHLGVDLDFTIQEIYEIAPTLADFRLILEETTSAGAVTINDASRELNLTFKNDADLQNGDTLLIVGNIPLKLNVVQLPVVLNYHFGKGKLEGLIHTGIAFDYFYTKLNTIDFDVYKKGRLITEPIVFEPLIDAEWSFSLYLGAGFKYHINDRFNLGFSTKLDFTELILSRHEIGVYYQF